MTLRDTQKEFYALNLDAKQFIPSISEDVNIIKLKIDEAHFDGALKPIGSTYDFQNNIIKDSTMYDGKKLVTFAGILKHKTFPLSEILIDFMEIGRKEMNNHIEVEFAVNFPKNGQDVITSYSIHYTKLYDFGTTGIIVFFNGNLFADIFFCNS